MTLEELYRLLRRSHMQCVFDTIDQPFVVLDEVGVVLDANPAFFRTFHVEREETVGAALTVLGSGQWNIPDLTRLISEIVPKATAVLEYEVSHAFPAIGPRTFLLTARKMSKPDGDSRTVLLVFDDVTDRRSQEHESAVLLSEVRHRMKNLLMVVRALANQADTSGLTAQEFKTAFLGRFEALILAQPLTAGSLSSVALLELVSGIVKGIGAEGLTISGGPSVNVSARQVIPLTMILHELATNALKYGAFADQAGGVNVSWTTQEMHNENSVSIGKATL